MGFLEIFRSLFSCHHKVVMCTLQGRRTFGMKSKLEVIDDFVYDGVLLDEGDNFHPATTMRAKERVHFMDLADHFGPTSGGYK